MYRFILSLALVVPSIATSPVSQPARGQCPVPPPLTVCPPPQPIQCPGDLIGDFCDGEGWFIGPAGGGVLLNGNQVQVDQNCDGDVSDPQDLIFALPAANAGDPGQVLSGCGGCDIELRLSPTQEFLFVSIFNPSGGSVPGCTLSQVRVWFYKLGTPPNLIPFTGIHQGACINSIAIGPVFHDRPGNPIRTGVLVATSNLAGNQAVLWADLANGAVNLDSLNYVSQVQWPQFSQEGNAAFILSLNGPNPDRHAIVDLCASPLGAALAVGSFPLGTTQVTSAQVTGSTGSFSAVIAHNGGGGGQITVPLDDCLCGACCDGAICTDNVSAVDCISPSVFFPGGSCTPDPCQQPAPEVCCFSNGTCQNLAPADCTTMGGTPQGSGSTCATANCQPVTEACCDPASGQCVDVEPDLCTSSGWNPQGQGTTCATLMPFCPPPAGTEACCLPNGACANFSVATCIVGFGGVAQGAGTNCFDPNVNCPTAALSVSKAAPATVAEGEALTYTLTYGNAGPDSAFGVVVAETLPVGAIFVSAGNTPGGAAPTVAGSLISWPVGTLAASVNQQVTVTVRVGCNVPNNQITNSVYSIEGTPGGTVNGAAVVTNVTPAPQDPVLIAVSSVDLNGAPLKSDELVEHTITLTNTAAVTHHGVSVNGQFGGDVDAGFVSAFEAAVNSAGGTFIVNPNNLRFRWEGDLGPSAIINIVFTTRVDSCIPVTQNIEILNLGSPVTVRNPCNVELGSTTPTDVFTLVRPIEAELVALNLAQTGAATVAARAGATIQFEMRLIEQCNTNQPNVSASLVIPAGITPDPLADPLINPPAGASYDPNTRTISYAGPVDVGQTLSIRWNGLLDIGGPCPVDLTFSGSVGACANIEKSLRILVVPVLPTGPHLIGLSPFEGLWLFETDVAVFNQLLCIQGEFLTGLGRTPSGDIWVTGATQVIRFNPVTEPPEIEFFTEDFLINELGIDNPGDVAFDPTTPAPSVIIVGRDGFGSIGSVRRYTPSKPAGQRVDIILDDPQLQTLKRVNIDPEGMIVAISDSLLIRIDPTAPLPLAPGDYAQFDLTIDSNFAGQPGTRFPTTPVNLSLDRDGDYLLTVRTAFTEDFGDPLALPLRLTSFYSLAKVDRASGTVGVPTGTPSTIVELLGGSVLCFGTCPPNPPPADLSGALFGGLDFVSFRGSALGPACDLFLGSEQFGGVWAVHRSTNPVSGTPFPLPSPGVDLESVNIGTASIPGDMNCDCASNLLDVGPFVLALTDPAGYAAAFSNCDINNADLNGDGNRNGLDIQEFVASLVP